MADLPPIPPTPPTGDDSASSNSTQPFCTQCGTPATGDAFCHQCGHRLDGSAAVTGPVPTPPGVQAAAGFCSTCGGDGHRLDNDRVWCPECRWLRPLQPGYDLPLESFLWALDAEAMARLNNLGPVTRAAQEISQRLGRPVFEAAVNGVRLSERQMPEIFELAIEAARRVGLPFLPEIYVSGERIWDAYTLGGDEGCFVALGSVLTNFRGEDLLFLLAREMGHIRAGHVYWNTALEFAFGQQRGQSTVLGEGALQFLNPLKMVESAIEVPLMAWARHAEITADRAALLAVGDLEVARRVMMRWTLKSFPIWDRIDVDAWIEQEQMAGDPNQRMAEMTMSSKPYLSSRLQVLSGMAAQAEFAPWSDQMKALPLPEVAAQPSRSAARVRPPRPPQGVRIVCSKCKEPMSVDPKKLQGSEPVHVRCPNGDCKAVLRLQPRPTADTSQLTDG